MTKAELDRMVKEIRSSPVIAKLEDMARDLAGIVLLIYVRHGDRVQELYATGRPAVLPEFCRVIRQSTAGRKRCAACRQLIAFGAAYRGLSEFSCHGGVSLIAAPGDSQTDYDPAESVVVASCAFAHADHDSGWKAARNHAADLPLDLIELRHAYRQLPSLTEEKVGLVNSIVEVAAVAVEEVRTRVTACGQKRRPAGPRSDDEIEAHIGSALMLSRGRQFRHRGEATGEVLVALVAAMVSRDPGLPFSVANISRAARITPNYFSMLFRKHSGQTFVSFLNERRVEIAKKHLRDLRLSVAEIADLAGFSDAGYFGRRFKQSTGLTPDAWRKRGGNQ